MQLLFFTEARLYQTVKGEFYSADQSYSFQMFKRYLKVFENVVIVARTTLACYENADEQTRVDKNGVSVLPLPYYIGPYQYLVRRNKILRTLKNYIDRNPDSAVICRVPGVIGTAAARYLYKKNRSYGVEVVGDPRDVFAPGSFNHPLRIVFRYSGVINLKFVVKQACSAVYVTKETLQLRYPTKSGIFSIHSSDVILPEEAFVKKSKILKRNPPFLIVAVGSLAAMYKSPDIAIEAMAILKKEGIRIYLLWVGDGQFRSEMEALAEKMGISDRISFVGNVPSANEVRNFLDEADIFIMPSRTEGLPRALVEAMARGLPCIATNIGGIPELLDTQALVPINDAKCLAGKIKLFLNTPVITNNQANRNLKEAQNYALNILDNKRMKFYKHVREASLKKVLFK